MKHIHTFESFLNEGNKMAMSYRLNSNDEHNVEQMWVQLSEDTSKSRGEIVDEIFDKLRINWFEISAWLKRNYGK